MNPSRRKVGAQEIKLRQEPAKIYFWHGNCAKAGSKAFWAKSKLREISAFVS